MLGPDLRVLIPLEYPGVSPRGSPDKAMVNEVGAGLAAGSRGAAATELLGPGGPGTAAAAARCCQWPAAAAAGGGAGDYSPAQ